MATGLFVCGNLDKQSEMTVRCVMEPIIETVDDLVIFDWAKTKLEKTVQNIHEAKLVKYRIEDCKDWREIRDMYKRLLKENDIDTFIIFKVVLSAGFKRGDMGKVIGFKNKLKQGDMTTSFNYMSSKVLLAKYMFVEVASRICDNVYHFVLDPQEASFTDTIKFKHFERLYGMNNKTHRFMPCFEYGLSKNGFTLDKEIDFVFYCSAATEDRAHIAAAKDKLEAVKGWDVQINIPRGKQVGEKKTTPLSQSKYYERLAGSKYTACVRAYDETAFSLYRFLEALAHGCLSFVFSDCCIDDVETTFPQIHKIISDYLIVDSFKQIRDNIRNWPEKKRLGLLKKIRQTDDWQQAIKLSYLKDCWGKLDGINVKGR